LPGTRTTLTTKVTKEYQESSGTLVFVRIRWKVLTIPVLWAVFVSPAQADSPLPKNVRVSRVVILKSVRELRLMDGDKVLKTYKVALGPHPVGPKQKQGDGKTPEGVYTISGRNINSAYHRSLRVSYPSGEDVARAKKAGVDPGGDIFIHGLPKAYAWLGEAHRMHDWTLGCIAVTNDEIEEIWRAVPNGTTVEIKP
jgi:murein L,D-transpeptidase YafK